MPDSVDDYFTRPDETRPLDTEAIGTSRLAPHLQATGWVPMLEGRQPEELPRDLLSFGDRYVPAGSLGEGGMGEVRQYLDSVVGRSVAVKFLHRSLSGDDLANARFLREARVQAQLEHPAVLPVYDMGLAEDDKVFFTMRKVVGRTLASLIKESRADVRSASTGSVTPAQRRMLSALSDVCLAIDYAHSRGVVHRDLKPANVMVGDFGEIYIIDWGLARLADDGPPSSPGDAPLDPTQIAGAAAAVTTGGGVSGTFGYMAPEQLEGRPLGPPADVYALGTILFEILSGERLHKGKSFDELANTTLQGSIGRIRTVANDIGMAPELERLCIEATAVDVESRISSARVVHERLEGFLGGDRDLARRRALADELATSARDLALRARGAGDTGARTKALREASRSLALDPDQRTAPSVLMQLLLEPPPTPPPEVAQEIADTLREDNRLHAKLAVAGYGVWLLGVPFLLWMGIEDYVLGNAMIVMIAVCTLASVMAMRNPEYTELRMFGAAILNAANLFLVTRLFGPLVMVPMLAVSTGTVFSMHGSRTARIVGPTAAAAAIVVAVICEAVGWLDPSYLFSDGTMSIVSQVVGTPAIASVVTLTVFSCTAIGMAAWFGARVRGKLDQARRQNMMLLWQYRQLVPTQRA